jgi:hypothetical protein
VVATWNPSVVFVPDSVHDGKLNPGLAGRIYMFGPEIGCPLLGNGCLAVQLFDVSKPGADPDAHPLEEWRLSSETLKQLQKRDAVGWGYTVFLPWGTYRPDITQIRLKVCYQPPKGFPLYATSGPMRLVDEDQLRTLATGLAQVPRKGVQEQKAGSPTMTQTVVQTAGQQLAR